MQYPQSLPNPECIAPWCPEFGNKVDTKLECSLCKTNLGRVEFRPPFGRAWVPHCARFRGTRLPEPVLRAAREEDLLRIRTTSALLIEARKMHTDGKINDEEIALVRCTLEPIYSSAYYVSERMFKLSLDTSHTAVGVWAMEKINSGVHIPLLNGYVVLQTISNANYPYFRCPVTENGTADPCSWYSTLTDAELESDREFSAKHRIEDWICTRCGNKVNAQPRVFSGDPKDAPYDWWYCFNCKGKDNPNTGAKSLPAIPSGQTRIVF